MQRRRRLYPIRGRESPNRKTHASKAAEPKRCMQSEREREKQQYVHASEVVGGKKKGGNRRREARQWAGLLSSRIRCRHPQARGQQSTGSTDGWRGRAPPQRAYHQLRNRGSCLLLRVLHYYPAAGPRARGDARAPVILLGRPAALQQILIDTMVLEHVPLFWISSF